MLEPLNSIFAWLIIINEHEPELEPQPQEYWLKTFAVYV